MKNRVVTSPPLVIGSTNILQIDVSRQEMEEEELLAVILDNNLSIEEAVGGHGFAEQQFEQENTGRLTPLSTQLSSGRLQQYISTVGDRLQLCSWVTGERLY